MKKTAMVLIFALLIAPAFAQALPDAANPATVAAPVQAAPAAPPDINAVLSELLKRMPTPPQVQTADEHKSWDGTLQSLVTTLPIIFGCFLSLWKLLHDHHDRVDERSGAPSSDEISAAQAVLKAAKISALLLIWFLLLPGCGHHERCMPPVAEARPNYTHTCENGQCR